MTEYVTQSAFARQCGVTRQALSKAIKEGRVIKTARGIDPDNPSNQYYKSKAGYRKVSRKRPKKKEKSPPVKVPVRVNAPPEKPEDLFEVAEGGPRPKDKIPPGQPGAFDMFQKAYEETRLKKIQADMAVLKYAEQVGAVVDVETLKQKMNAFSGALFSQLVYLPENIADDLWMSARGHEDPERKIREMLSARIENIIENAKAAAAGVLPPEKGIKYVMLGLEDEEGD